MRKAAQALLTYLNNVPSAYILLIIAPRRTRFGYKGTSYKAHVVTSNTIERTISLSTLRYLNANILIEAVDHKEMPDGRHYTYYRPSAEKGSVPNA